jgi:hypothetical protein
LLYSHRVFHLTVWRVKTGKKINADVNAALNIARRLGYRIKIAKKIESYHVTHNGVKPLIPNQRANTRDPEIQNLALKGGKGSLAIGLAIEF